MTRAIIVKREGAYIVAAEGAAVVGSLTAQAKAARDAAAASAALAESARDVAVTEGPFYTSVGAGEAATTTGDEFAVVVDGVASWYRRTSGGSALLYTLPTNGSIVQITTLAGLETIPVGGTAYATDVNAFYEYDAASSATIDDWVVISALGGVGRWLLASDSITVHAIGGGSSDTARMTAAANAIAAVGKTLKLAPESYTFATQWVLPRKALTLVGTPLTRIISTLTSGVGSPGNAVLFCGPGAPDITSTVAAANTVGANTVRSAANVPAGHDVRVWKNTPFNRFRGSTYRVISSVLDSGSYILTLDRPVLTQFGVGDQVDAWALGLPRDTHIIGNGMTVEGTGDRLAEFIAVAGWRVENVKFRPGAGVESCASFDSMGHHNHWIDCDADAGTSGANNGFLLETQEGSTTRVRSRGFAVDGVRYLNVENCQDYSTLTGNNDGSVVSGEGGDFLGSNNVQLHGTYDRNTTAGVAIVVGSRNVTLYGKARFNATNVVVGDGDGGEVTNARLYGDCSKSTNIGVTVFPATKGTVISCDTSDCVIGVNNSGAEVSLTGWSHRGTAATNALLNAGGTAKLDAIDVDITSAGVNVIQTTGAGRTVVASGSVKAGAASNLFNGAGTSTTIIGALKGVSSGASNGLYLDTSAVGQTTDMTDFTGVGTGVAGPGHNRTARTMSRLIGAVGTTAVTTEEYLKAYTIPANGIVPGERVRVSAWGTLENNANTKTLRVRIDGTALFAVAMPVSTNAGWKVDVEIYSTGSATQEYIATITAGTTSTTASGSLTKDQAASIAVQLSGQNGTASANDIVASGMTVRLEPLP